MRGRYQVKSISLAGGDALGLFHMRHSLRVEPGLEFIIGPGLVTAGARVAQAAGVPDRQTGTVGSQYHVGHGEEFRGIRPYAPGDDLRQVHWKSTARAGSLVVREFHNRGKGKALVIWDGQFPADHDAGLVEWGLRLVASLREVLVQGGTPCGLLRLDSSPEYWDDTDARSFNWPAYIDALADANALRTTSFLEAATAWRIRENMIFLVSSSLDSGIAEVVAQWHRQGRRVTIALLKGSQSKHKAEHDEAPGKSAYDVQAEVLSRVAQRVVLVNPQHELSPSGCVSSLRLALNQMLDAAPQRRAPQETEAGVEALA
jgi:uncharacterized protein (DUF58 family)